MTRRDDVVASVAVTVWVFALPAVLFLVWAALRGFDPGMCDAFGACEWRRA